MNTTKLRRLDRRVFLQFTAANAGCFLAGTEAIAWQRTANVPGKELIVYSATPHNAEPALKDLVASWLTPIKYFYVRSHAPFPKIDVESFRLSIEGMVNRPFRITLADLQQRFSKQSVVATMTCAGNRRSEHSLVKPIDGVPWQAGAIGNARWGGVQLADLLKKAGVQQGATHVWFQGVDEIKRTSGIIPFGASIPLSKAMSDDNSAPGALVVYEMNGESLLPDHGFPMRTVVPGYIGARSVKWLGKIIVSDRPSTNRYVARAYKLVTEGTGDEWSAAPPIESFVINSVTCLPAADSKLKAGVIKVSGYALPPGIAGRTIAKVEVSADGGRTWTRARFTSEAKPFCWQLWSADLSVTPQTRDLVVRATDSAGGSQPKRIDWNMRGYLFNGWHRTPVTIDA